MAIIDVKPLPQRTKRQDQFWKRYYTTEWFVEVDSIDDGADAVSKAPGIHYGDIYQWGLERDTGSFCNTIETECTSVDGKNWKVKFNYGPYDPTTFPQNPIEWPLKINWSFTAYEESVDEDKDGKAVVNSAGDYFDPPITRDDNRPLLRVEKNESTFDPMKAKQYKDAIASDTFFGFDPYTVKCKDIQADLNYNPDAGGFYYTVHYEFEVNPKGWKKEILDRGFRKLNGSAQEPILQKNGYPVTSPVMLDGSGGVLAVGGDPVPLTFRLYDELAFASLGLDPSGQPGQV